MTTNGALLFLAKTFAKFSFVCIYKSLPEMDDNLLAIFTYTAINMLGLLATLTKMYLPGKPTLDYVNRL